MIIDIKYIKENYPKCCVVSTSINYVEIDNKNYYLHLEEFKTLEGFEEKYNKVLNGLGYLITIDGSWKYDYWKLIDDNYFIYMCIV